MNTRLRLVSLARAAAPCLAALLTAALFSPSASATLGGDMASVEADQQALNASQQIAANNAAYTVYELQTAAGTKVREYVSSAGTVFAAVWDGPSLPDLRQLLGDYFAEYTGAATGAHAGHGHLVVQRPDLVVESSGHMRAFFGRAYLPNRLPQGAAAAEIR